jgi:regulator of replication initiation timing
MTENLLHKLEEKMMALLTELETLRRDVDGLRRENTGLKVEREKLEERVKGIIGLLETVNTPDAAQLGAGSVVTPVFAQQG